MLVALAVMTLAMALVTNVFSITTKTAATSAAIAEVEQLARDCALQVERDLEHCDPARSVLVIHGRTLPAGLTEEGAQAGQYYRELVGDPDNAVGFDPVYGVGANPALNGYSDPRADILMFFTERPSASQAPAADNPFDDFEAAIQRGARVSPVQVVYGHAAIDTALRNGDSWDFANNPTHIDQARPNGLSQLPVTRWHLGRRVALLNAPTGLVPLLWAVDLADRGYPQVWRCFRDDADARRYAGDSVVFDLARLLEYGSPLSPPNVPLASLSPYGFLREAGAAGYLGTPLWNGADRGVVLNLLYRGGNYTNHHVATVIEQPPAELRDNLGVHQLPGCAWFQVEILIPEDPRNGLDHPLSAQRRDTPRWVTVDPGHTYVFVPDSDDNRTFLTTDPTQVEPPWAANPGRTVNGSRLHSFAQVIPRMKAMEMNMARNGDTPDNRRVRLWPYAIRVTIRVFDGRGRLENPIKRTIVHRFD